MSRNQIRKRLSDLEKKLEPERRCIVILTNIDETVEEAKKRVLREKGITKVSSKDLFVIVDRNQFRPKQESK